MVNGDPIPNTTYDCDMCYIPRVKIASGTVMTIMGDRVILSRCDDFQLYFDDDTHKNACHVFPI